MSQKLASGALAAARRLGQSAVSRRGLASGSDYLVSAPHPSIERVQVVTMQRGPVNQLDLDFLKSFPAKIKELEEDSNTHGFILTSAQPKTFSAGLDIPFLFDKEEAFLRDFGAAFQDCWAALYGTPLAVVAAVNGHALAGGCLLAAAADYRIADKSATIGLPEVHLGILAPYYLREMVKQLMGHRACEWALITGHALSADLSQSLGLVDEVKDSVAEVNKSADAMIKLLTTLNPKGRSESKVSMRQDLLDRTAARRQQNIDEFAAVIHDKEVQTSIRQYFEALAKKQKDKKQ